jgi:UDPglucose 6-dehydrogenase
MSMPIIGFAGMTHLGLVSAAAIAARGFTTLCFDPDRALIERLGDADLPVLEPGLDELVRSNQGRQSFTADIEALERCDIVYIAPDVPTSSTGASDLAGIRALIAQAVPRLISDAILVVLSQVPPGFTRGIRGLAAERIYYQVETLVFGNAVERATKPERFIIGCADPACPIASPYRVLLEAFGCPILPMRYESAELAKISINMCLAASIGVANTLAELCERIGADWSEIMPALRLDRRIGPYSYLAPGLGIAGGNLERDLATIIGLAEAHGTDAGIVRACVANSRHRRTWAARTIGRELLDAKPEATVAVWGLAYKENTRSVKNSPSIATIAELDRANLRLHDPVVPAAEVSPRGAQAFQDPLQAAAGADALMILTPWPQYRAIPAEKIGARLAGRIVVDPYGVLDGTAARAAGLAWHTLGRAPEMGLGGGAACSST